MADEKHLLLEIGGTYATAAMLSPEIWICTLRLALVDGIVDPSGTLPSNWSVSTVDINRTETSWTITGNWRAQDGLAYFNPDDWLNDQAAPAVAAWIAQADICSNTYVKTLKVYPIGSPLGKSIPNPDQTVGTPVILTWDGIGPQGGGSAPSMPAQDALVVSHRTNQIGRKGRGRMYLPGLSVGLLTTGGRASSGAVASALAAQVTMLEAIKFSGSGSDSWNVRPIVTGKPFVKYGVINSVQVGDVVDTQQRRRDRLVEARQVAPVTY